MEHVAQPGVLSSKTTVIFDLDGTLVDSVPDLALSINGMLTTLNLATFSTDVIRSWVGNGAKILVERALSGHRDIDESLGSEYAEQALDIFLTHYRDNVCVDTCLYEGVMDTLQTLKQRGYKLHIVTNKPLEFVSPILSALNIAKPFETILGADSLPKKKPDPMPLSYLCDIHHTAVEQCLMVGDSKNDILAANAIDMQSIAVTYGYNYGENINDHNPTLVCDSFRQLLNYLPAISP